MYFVSYTNNKYSLPENGWNVWEVKENNKRPGSTRSFKIDKILIGGKKSWSLKSQNDISVSNPKENIAENKREVFERVFEIASKIDK